MALSEPAANQRKGYWLTQSHSAGWGMPIGGVWGGGVSFRSSEFSLI